MAKKRLRFTEPSEDNWDSLSEEEREEVVKDWPEYYRTHYGNTQMRKFFLDWVKENVEKDAMPAIKAGIAFVTPFEGSWARIISRGYGTKVIVDYLLNKSTPKIIAYGESVLAEKKSFQELKSKPLGKVYNPSIQERVAEQTRWILGDVEGELDKFLENKCKKSKFDLYKFLQKREVKGPHTKKIYDHYNDILRELVELVEGDDEQLNEGYAFLSDSQQRKYYEFVKKMVGDIEAWGNVLKSKRKPRTRKAMSVQQRTAKVKYKERDDTYKIVSVSPVNLVEATQVWIFNTKDRFLYKYISQRGMNVKGTTLQDFDEAGSFKKKIRKPDAILPDVIGSGKVKLRKLMDGINSKETKVTGRINKDMIILRVI